MPAIQTQQRFRAGRCGQRCQGRPRSGVGLGLLLALLLSAPPTALTQPRVTPVTPPARRSTKPDKTAKPDKAAKPDKTAKPGKIPPTRKSVTPGKTPPARKTVTTKDAHSQTPGTSKAAPQPVDPYAGLDHTGTPPLPPRTEGKSPKGAAHGKKRRIPTYDGRRPARLTAGQVLIWIPRVLFFPVHVTLEYLLRWPIVKLITVLEKHYVIERVKGIFTFANGKGSWLPTFLKEFGRFNQVGAFFQYKDLGVPGHRLILQAAFWTNHWYHAKAIDQFKVFRNNRGTVKIRGEFRYRPDSVFYGLGPDSLTEAKSFYRIRHTEVELSLHAVLTGLNRFKAGLFYRNVEISNGQSPAIVSPESEPFFGTDFATTVPGFGDTYNLMTAQLKLDLDTRSPERIDTIGSGLRMELLGSYSIDPQNLDSRGSPRLHFAQWGGEVSGFWDVTGRSHVLSLRVYVTAQERIGSDPLPIHERLKLGGKEYLRGFISGRFRGDSAFVASAQYRYPIWWMLDANLFASVGNVFTGRFEDFGFRRMVMSWGIGVRTNTSKAVSFDVLVAFGSNQFQYWDEKFKLDNIRLLIGINQGF